MTVPALGDQVPRWGNPLLRALGRATLSLCGWRIEGAVPNLPKCVLIVAPHTSNRDFVVGIAALFALGFRATYLGKHTLFRGPLGWFMRWTGGIPVDRDAADGVVAGALGLVRGRGRIFLTLAPEGTRQKVERWKSGYYRIAAGAGIPIFPVALDYARKVVALLPLFIPTGRQSEDEDALRALYSPAMARHPERY
ncbi:MAG TPA: lysophospholipid acyltransferase family protein [Vicinamibacteria bacterium]|nr:lysophospholipid acyltransferase family protein [Vicinamibacteria bacterium]